MCLHRHQQNPTLDEVLKTDSPKHKRAKQSICFIFSLKMAELLLLKLSENMYPIPSTENSFTLTLKLAKLQNPAFSCL